MKLDTNMRKILYIILAIVLEALAVSMIFFAEYYNLCIENNYILIVLIVFVSDMLLSQWHELLKKVENM